MAGDAAMETGTRAGDGAVPAAAQPPRAPTTWLWDFGDGGSSTAQSPAHTYVRGGRYTVSLTVTNDFGSDTETKADHVSAATFSDVLPDHWAWTQVEAGFAEGLVSGYKDGTFHPTSSVSREQMAVFLARGLAGGETNIPVGPETPAFTDVDATSWAYNHIEYVAAQKVAMGFKTDGGYHPKEPVTRGQMAAFLARSMEPPEERPDLPNYTPPVTAPSFSDVPADFSFYKSIEYINEHGVTHGMGDGLYHPGNVCTRAQMAVFLAVAFQLM